MMRPAAWGAALLAASLPAGGPHGLAADEAALPPTVSVVPKPAKVEPRPGVFTLSPATRVLADSRAWAEAVYLVQLLRQLFPQELVEAVPHASWWFTQSQGYYTPQDMREMVALVHGRGRTSVAWVGPMTGGAAAPPPFPGQRPP